MSKAICGMYHNFFQGEVYVWESMVMEIEVFVVSICLLIFLVKVISE